MQQFIGDYIDRHQSAVQALARCADDIERIAGVCVAALKAGNKILICGNGGSAADAQHMAAELVGRFVSDRSTGRDRSDDGYVGAYGHCERLWVAMYSVGKWRVLRSLGMFFGHLYLR